MKINRDLIVAIVLSILFSTVFYYIFSIIPLALHEILLQYIPDPYFSGGDSSSIYNSIEEELFPIGTLLFLILILLIIIGLVIKRFKLSSLSSFALYLPVFANFCFIMFKFAGLGLTRFLWYPILQINPYILDLGDFIVPLTFLVEDLEHLLYSVTPPPLNLLIMPIYFLVRIFFAIVISSLGAFGAGIFLLSIVTWFYGKFTKKNLLDFWVYKYSRHPQYLGLILWSYALNVSLLPISIGISSMYGISPTIFWLISALFIIGAAIQEENQLKTVLKEEHEIWRQNTPFLIPIPSRIKNGIQWFVKRLIKKDWPINNKETLIVLAFFGTLIIVSSLLFMIVVGFLSNIFMFISGLIDWYP